jgi:hypothetical protein
MSLINDGVELFEDNVFDLDIEECSMLFNSLYFENKNSSYGNVASFDLFEVLEIPKLNGIYQKVLEKFRFSEHAFKLAKLWLVKTEYENSDTSKLPYVPHIDYQRFLKVMIYLDDIGAADGPFHALPMCPDDNERLRLSLKPNYKKNQENKVESFFCDEYVEYTAPAGSVLLFDTNCPHFAGVVSKNGKRRVMRFDFSCSNWERPKINRLKNMLGNILRK